MLVGSAAFAQYKPADQGQRPGNGGILPEQFLRGFDPITVYFGSDQVGDKANADDGNKRLKITPEWPGAYVWVDKKTLQFRPAEPWPALARFQVDASGNRKVLTTMMSAPSAMSPTPGTEGLRPFRVITLTFPQAYPVASLKKMLSIEVRDLPGLGDSPARKVNNYALAPLPRATHRDPATWTVTLEEDVPEGKQLVVNVSLALGNEGTTLWQGRAATRTPFTLTEVRCGNANFPLVGGASTPKDLALGCGNRGDMPQLLFSAPVQDLTLTALRKLVRLEPSVPDLRFQVYGSRVQLVGKFVPDTLYKLSLASAPIRDDAQRPLRDVKAADVYFHLGWKTPFLAWTQGTAMLEAKGPRTLPLRGYGEARADVRVYRVDPMHTGLWPWPESPVTIDEQSDPPFPGEEPSIPASPSDYADASSVSRHVRLLGSPLVSRLVDLPLQDKSGATTFGLDLKPLLDDVVGANRPGTYLVGLRRLTGRSERTYMRVQITNLSVTSVEETGRAVLYVRTLDGGDPARGASVLLEGLAGSPRQIVKKTLSCDQDGRVEIAPLGWDSITRVSIASGDDVLVLDPRERLPVFANNHWSSSDQWLSWLLAKQIPAPVNDTTLGFIFPERGIYRPGEPVFIKAYVRNKVSGELRVPSDLKRFGIQVIGPDGTAYPVTVKTSVLGGLEATFKEADVPTGDYQLSLYDRNPESFLARRGFKIEAYRIPTFEVQLTGSLRVRNDGPFKVKAVARYYAGGNVANQPIAWTVTQRPWDWYPKGMPGFLFANSTQFARPSSQSTPGVTSQQGELDDNGAAEITMNPQLDLDGSPRIYRFEATVTGPDEQPVTTTTEVKALPSFVLGLKIPRYLEKATELKPEVVAVGVDDKPMKGQDVRVRVFRRVWHSTLRETSFATGQAKYQTEQEDIQVAEKILTSGTEAVSNAFPITESGVYVVELFARDKLGRVQTLSADLYIGGSTPQSWQKSRDGVFELKPDKKEYSPGDVAHVLVQSPFVTARALVVIEEATGNRYLWKDIGGSKAVIDVPITDRFVPNLPMHVVLMRGRLGEGKADDARYKPATVASSIDLQVTAVKNTVVVNVAHPEMARPGTKHDFVITLTDDQKKPIGGEVTLWLVDEAVLSLAKEGSLDPLTELIKRNQRAVSIRDSRNLVVGRVSELEEEPGGDGSDEENTGSKKMVRKDFKTVPYYAATLTVPPSGKLVVPVQLSDDLTTFRVRAVAVSGGMRFGFKQDSIKVRLPVLVQPQLPRFVRMGDTFWPGAVARLVEGAEGPGVVDVKITGPVDAKSSQEKIDLKANKAISVLTAATVKSVPLSKDQSVTVRVDVTRLSDKAGDAFEVKLPLLPDRTLEKRALFTTFQPGKVNAPEFPEAPRAGTGSQTLIFTNQPGLLEFASGLEYLSAYPHGCLEQRMSQVSPDLAMGGFLKKLELDTRFTPQIQANTRRILDELKQHQDEQGFFSYWPGGRGDVALTAQGLEFMVAAKKAGLAVDENVMRRSVDGLKRVLRTDFNGLWADYRYNQQTAALRALGTMGELDENYLVELFNKRKSMDAVALADLTSAMALRPNTFQTNLTALKGELWDSTVFKLVKGNQVFDGIRGDRTSWNGLYLGSSAATTAAVWEALLKTDPGNSKHPLIRDALLSRSNPTWGFGSTHANRRALAALGVYLEKNTSPQAKTTISITGVDTVVLENEKRAGRRTLDADVPAVVTVTGGPVTARVQQRYLPASPGWSVESKKDGFIVSRSLTWIHSDGSADTFHDDKAGATLAVPLGEILEINAQLVTDEPRNHVALVVPIAAGLEPLNPNLETASSDAKPSQPDSITPTYVQRLDNEVRYYFTELPRGTHTFHFRVRASSEGKFVHPPPYAEMMYREEVRGRGAGMKIVVTGGHEK
ncbi:MAG: alpha-2-macroglobulin family protein [Myxococcaceae bacterium]